jgi:lipase maturation factor 1
MKWFAPGAPYVRARWLWLRALGLIFFSAFYSLLFQIHGLIGPNGILPAREYLPALEQITGWKAYWLAPTLLWISTSDAMLNVIVWLGIAASIAIVVNFFPRIAIAVAGICFLSFIGAAQDFASYQSDGMLLEAALLSLFLGSKKEPPSRAAVFMLQWEWFRIYFESGVVKFLSGEPQWRNLTAMDKYYENGPLPTWIGWHTQQLPHSFHAFTAAYTLIVELLVVWLLFLPKKSKLIAFVLTTPLQIAIIITANYAFLNYLVLALGIFLLEDRLKPVLTSVRTGFSLSVVLLPVLFITTVASFMFPNFPTVRLLEPFRVANSYGLFAVMTRARYEIEFQGTRDGEHWIAYPFRYKPQDPMKPPGIYAPYQPRFEWNLWFASLGSWDGNRWVLNTEARLLENEPSVLKLFAGNPFAGAPPTTVRAVQWQYWFTTREERRRTGAWWRRELIGDYAPSVTRQ